MGTYNLPRNVKGEGRILFIFSRKSLMWTAGFALVGIGIYFMLSYIGMGMVGITVTGILALIGFSIGTFKVPNIKSIKWTSANAGQNIDDIIKRTIMFKKKGNRIYIYKGEDTNDK